MHRSMESKRDSRHTLTSSPLKSAPILEARWHGECVQRDKTVLDALILEKALRARGRGTVTCNPS